MNGLEYCLIDALGLSFWIVWSKRIQEHSSYVSERFRVSGFKNREVWCCSCINTITDLYGIVLCSIRLCRFCRTWPSSVLQLKQFQDKIHPWLLHLHRSLCCTLLHRISLHLWSWISSHLYFCFQCDNASDFLFCCNGWDTSGFLIGL